MRLRTNLIVNLTGLGLQVLNMFSDNWGPKAKTGIALGVGIAQLVVAQLAQYHNPDGTPATTAWVPGPNPSPVAAPLPATGGATPTAL